MVHVSSVGQKQSSVCSAWFLLRWGPGKDKAARVRRPAAPLPLQPATHPAARGQCCNMNEKQQLAGTSGRKQQLKSRHEDLSLTTACRNPPPTPKEPTEFARVEQAASMCLGPGRSPLLTPAPGTHLSSNPEAPVWKRHHGTL